MGLLGSLKKLKKKIKSWSARSETKLEESRKRLEESRKQTDTYNAFYRLTNQYRTAADKESIIAYNMLANILRIDPGDGQYEQVEQVVSAFNANPIAAAAWLSEEGRKRMKNGMEDVFKATGLTRTSDSP